VVCRQERRILYPYGTLQFIVLGSVVVPRADYEDDPQCIKVTAALKLNLKDHSKLGHSASSLGMEKGMLSVSWLGLEAEPTTSRLEWKPAPGDWRTI
jgi:hypothetical protein